MALDLDPAGNPLLRLYALGDLPGIALEDGFKYLRVSAGLRALGGAARDLVGFLHRRCFAEVRASALWLGERRVLDFAARGVADWFDWEAIEILHREGAVSAPAYAALIEYEDAARLAHWPEDIDPVEDALAVLDFLAHHEGDDFELRISLDKDRAVAAYLTPETDADAAEGRQPVLYLVGEEGPGLSISVWYDVATLARACGDFEGLRQFFLRASRRPTALLFYGPMEEHASDFLYVRALTGDSVGGLEDRLRQLSSRRQAYADLVQRHRLEPRDAIGERFDLPPALLLQRDGRLSGYPRHPLFTEGLLWPLLVYTLLAWLAEHVEAAGAVYRFALPTIGDGHRELGLELRTTDVLFRGKSLGAAFQTPDQRRGAHRMLAALASDMQRCAGRRALRQLWTTAVEQEPSAGLEAGELWPALAAIHARFLELERRAGGILSRELDPSARDAGPPAGTPATGTPGAAAVPAGPSSPQAQPPAGDPSGALPDLELFIDIADPGGAPELRFELHGPLRGYLRRPVGSRRLNRGKDDSFADLSAMAQQELSGFLTPPATQTAPWMPAVGDLEAWGRQWWKNEVPRELREEYGKLRSEDRLKLLVVSSDPSFPWELAKPWQPDRQGKDRYDDPCWALKFSLGRWLAGHQPPEFELRFRRILCVITGRLPGAIRERRYFDDLALRLPSLQLTFPRTSAEVMQELRERSFDVIHFACHGEFREDRPGDSVVQLPDGYLLRVGDLEHPDIYSQVGASRPLVFLNACHTGRVESTWTDVGGWAKTFIDMGCGAFLGCGWEVADRLAATFSEVFYNRLQGVTEQGEPTPRRSLGDAVLEARQAVRDLYNSTWLAYYLYGNPSCRLA